MNERINTQDLVDLFATRHTVSKKEAEVFIKEFFLLIEQALENDRSVKIKGLGTFKLIEIEDRESINVNTGERFLIEGHTKVSFTPDNGLRDVINKPFSHFETVVLHENTVLPDTPIESAREEEALPEAVDPVIQKPSSPEIPSLPESDALEQSVEETHMISELSVSSSEGEVHEVVEISQEIIASSETEEIVEEIIVATDLTESVGQVPATRPEPSEEITEQPHEDTPNEVAEEATTVIEKESAAEGDPDQSLPAGEEMDEPQSAVPSPSPSHSFASPARKRLTAEEIIALEIQKADEEYKRSLKIPFLSYSEEKEKQKEEKKEKKQKELKPEQEKKQKKENNGKLQRYLVAVVLLVLFVCGGLLLYYYMPEWSERETGDRLAFENPVQETKEVAVQDPVEPGEGNTEEGIEEETQATQVVEEQPAVREVIREENRPAEVPARQEIPVTSGQTTSPSGASQTANPVPQNIASIPVRPDSVNYVIVGTKATHKIEEGETLTKVAYRFYGTKDLWPYIVMHNRTVIRNPNHVPFGTTIQIPELEKK